MGKWATVTVVDAQGKCHSIDVLAASSYDAAHLYLNAAKSNRASCLPVPTKDTVFEVVVDGKVHRVPGVKLQQWIVKRRGELGGPAGYLFSQRAVME